MVSPRSIVISELALLQRLYLDPSGASWEPKQQALEDEIARCEDWLIEQAVA